MNWGDTGKGNRIQGSLDSLRCFAMLGSGREWWEWWEWKGRERKRAIRDSSQAEQLFPLECASFVLWCTVVNVPLF